MTSVFKLIQRRKRTVSSSGRLVFLVFLALGSLCGLWLGNSGASQVKRRYAARSTERATAIATALDHAFAERLRALKLLAPIADATTIARFKTIYPEILSVVREPAKAPDGFHLSVPSKGGRLVATLGKDWPKPWLTARRGERVELVNLDTFKEARTMGKAKTAELRWRDGKIYQTSIERLRYPAASDGDLAIAVAVSNRQLASAASRFRWNGLLFGLILGVVPGIAAWFGIGRSTRRLRTANDALECRVRERTTELEAAERSFRGIFENTPIGLYQCDADGRFLRVNPTFARYLGYANPETLIASIQSLQKLGDPSRRSAFIAELQANGEAEMTSVVTTSKGRELWLSESARTIYAPDGAVQQIEGAIHDVSAQHALEDQLRKIGATDPLTGLLNRRGLDEALAIAPLPVSVLILDLDRFKDFNDTYGHPAGDRALQAVAVALKSVLRDDAIVARIGGEEFVVCLPAMASADAVRVADRLRQAVADCDKFASRLTVSAGVATAMERSDLDAAFVEADRALYQAKEAGRNKIVLR